MKKLLAMMVALMLILSVPALAETEETYLSSASASWFSTRRWTRRPRALRTPLTEKLGDQVSFDEQNASGDSANCITIMNAFLSENVDLILRQRHAGAAGGHRRPLRDTPILGTSVTDYATALDVLRLDECADGREHLRRLRPRAAGRPGRDDSGAVPGREGDRPAVLLGRGQFRLSGRRHRGLSDRDGLSSCTEYAFTDTNDVSPP